QRISIARALMRDPRILLLDEATSALDTSSERIVQSALENASRGRTTIVIAHRLSTVRNADCIVVMQRGKIVEKGTHEELLRKGEGEGEGVYAQLVMAQQLRTREDGGVGDGEGEGGIEETLQREAVKMSSLALEGGEGKGDGDVSAVEDEKKLQGTIQPIKSEHTIVTIVDPHHQQPASTTDSPHRSSPETKLTDAPLVRTDTIASTAAKSTKSETENEKEKGRNGKKNGKKEEFTEEEKDMLKRPMEWSRLAKMSAPEWYFLVVGGLAAAGNGVLFPMFSLIFSSILAVFGNPDIDQMRRDAIFWALMFLVLAASAFVVNFLQVSLFSITGERLTKRLRDLSFQALMRQEIGFFDEERNSTGVLTARLADDAAQVKGLTGQLMGTLLQAFVTAVSGLTIAFYYGWELTLVILAAVPLLIAGGALQLKVLTGFGGKAKKMYEDAGEIASEVIMNIRTVATLNKEDVFLGMYREKIEEPHRLTVKSALISSIAFGFSQGIMFFSYGLGFWFGSRLVVWERRDPDSVMKVLFSMIFTAVMVGQVSSFTPNVAKAKLASLSIFDLLDRPSKIDALTPPSTSGKKPSSTTITGHASATSVEFVYPSRPTTNILRSFSLDAAPGKTIALVGPSGCGKSTIIALLERFYDVKAGRVCLEDVDVREWNLRYLREQMALVGQEPVLFNMSIRENIAYGAPDGQTVTKEEIEAAARMANIHEFVISLPDGYDTIVGERGGQLSGGQKQRVAIARALIRKPKLLLLDEATSALDSESEQVVQTALDNAARDRTTIVIAHRLSTIQNADTIYVLKPGVDGEGSVVVENGRHFELLEKRGAYFELVAQQSLGAVN
ncbi:ATP-binding cassette, sub-B (MDR TAP), member 4, partial [Quaeritorhiza haematococci]